MRKTLSILEFILSVWPVIQRELRARARKPRYYWMRILGGTAAMLVVCSALLDSFSPSEASIGAFKKLSLLILALIVTTVPAMTSDCLSREKREGTLGLLFLAPLSPAGIVIGKIVTQALMAWSMWLSVLPAMAIPLLLGGITWKNLVIAAVFQSCAVLISLAAGLLASCLSKKRNLALFYAATLTCIFISSILISILSMGEAAFLTFANNYSWPKAFEYVSHRLTEDGLLSMISGGLSLVITLQIGGLPPRALGINDILLTTVLVGASCLALGILFAAIWFAARHIRKTWSDKPASARQQWWTQRFCTVLFQNAFRRKMQRSLDRNPIAWLQQYSWKARITKWGLCLLFISIELWAIPTDSRSLQRMDFIQVPLLVILATVGTVAGVGSFHSEKESGALELILTTPLSVNYIILGRVIGWWMQFLPAALLFLLFVGATQRTFYTLGEDIVWVSCFFAVAYLSLPFFTVYAALRIKYFIPAAALALIGLALEFAFGKGIALLLNNYDRPDTGLLFICTLVPSAAFVWLTFFLLRHSLSRRIYSF